MHPGSTAVKSDLDRILEDLRRQRERLEIGIGERNKAQEAREELIRDVEKLRTRMSRDQGSSKD